MRRKNVVKSVKLVALALTGLATLTAACAQMPPDEQGGPPASELEQRQNAVVGWAASSGFQGIASVTVAGDANVHTGVVLATDAAAGYSLILGGSASMDWNTTPANVTVEWAAPSPASVTRTARYINSNAYFPAAIIQVPAITGTVLPIDQRAGAALVGVSLTCYEYDSGTRLEYVSGDVTAASGNSLTLTYWAWPQGHQLENIDRGAACFDLSGWTLVGFVTAASATGATLHRVSPMASWIDGMKNLAATRNDSRSTKLALYNLPVAGQSTRMCLDLPWGSPYQNTAINQYACHYGPAQRFWLDYRVDANRPRIVSDSSGQCIDVPGGVTSSGTDLQQFPCHNGLNQRFELGLWGDALGGWKLRPAHAPSANLCMSVNNGASTSNGVPTEQRTCAAVGSTSNRDQRWFPVWNPVFTP